MPIEVFLCAAIIVEYDVTQRDSNRVRQIAVSTYDVVLYFSKADSFSHKIQGSLFKYVHTQ